MDNRIILYFNIRVDNGGRIFFEKSIYKTQFGVVHQKQAIVPKAIHEEGGITPDKILKRNVPETERNKIII